ncbi:hypothetical protein [Gordonia polyisoprenivorans]|uniref:hypothetical protein n=1 Tax=Gordonia polyisoprenivorans TaxID=84595 RepID=UPI0030CD7C89
MSVTLTAAVVVFARRGAFGAALELCGLVFTVRGVGAAVPAPPGLDSDFRIVEFDVTGGEDGTDRGAATFAGAGLAAERFCAGDADPVAACDLCSSFASKGN